MRKYTSRSAALSCATAFLAMGLALSINPGAQADDALMPAKEIVANAIKASGGREAFDKIETFRAVGGVEIPQFGELKLTLMHDNKGRFAVEQEAPGMGTSMVGSDGTYGWSQNMMTGQWELMDDAMLTGSRQQVELFQRVAPAAEVIARMETVAKVTRNDRPHWQVKLVEADGTQQMAFYDAESHNLSAVEFEQDMGFGPQKVTMTFSDWKPVGDLSFFHKVVMSGMMGMDIALNFSEIQINTLEGKEFAPPAPIAEQIRQREAAKKAAEAARDMGNTGGAKEKPDQN